MKPADQDTHFFHPHDESLLIMESRQWIVWISEQPLKYPCVLMRECVLIRGCVLFRLIYGTAILDEILYKAMNYLHE